MNPHNPRTALVYRLARQVAKRGTLDLSSNVFTARAGFVSAVLDHATGRIVVYAPEARASFFHATPDTCFHCAPTERPGRIDDEPTTWVQELKNELKEVAA